MIKLRNIEKCYRTNAEFTYVLPQKPAALFPIAFQYEW